MIAAGAGSVNTQLAGAGCFNTCMSAPDAFLFTGDFDEDDWKESILESRTDSISRDRSACRITIITDFDQYKAAVRFILGYSWVDENNFLRREVPVFHPVWPWLFARAITDISFTKATGKDTSLWEYAVPFATYTYAKITIEFTETRYDVLRDDEIDLYSTFGFAEWKRYVEQLPQSTVDFVQIDGGQLLAHAPSVATVDEKPYIAAPYILHRQEKSAFDLIWREVPKEFLFDADGFAPKLAAIQKKVNSSSFMGRAAGTLLCEKAKATIAPSPLATDVFDTLSFTYDVTLEMRYFNPDRGDTSVDKYGWNLLPGPRASGASGDTTIAYYYYTHDGELTGKPLYESYDFYKVFSHHSINT